MAFEQGCTYWPHTETHIEFIGNSDQRPKQRPGLRLKISMVEALQQHKGNKER